MTTAPNLRYLLGIVVTRARDFSKAFDGLPESKTLTGDIAALSAEERQQTVDYLTALAGTLYQVREHVLWLKHRVGTPAPEEGPDARQTL